MSIAVLLLAVRLAAGDAAGVEATARALQSAYASNDLQRVLSFFAPEAPDLPYIEVRLRNDFRVYCVETRSFTIGAVEIDGDDASVRTIAIVHREPRVEARAYDEFERRTLKLRRIGGTWKAMSWRTDEHDVADRILALDDQSIARSLIEHDEFGASLLQEYVLTLSERVATKQRLPGAAMRAALTAAEALGDPVSLSLAIPLWAEIMRTPSAERRPMLREKLGEAIALAEQSGDIDAKSVAMFFLAILELDADESSTEAERLMRWILDHRHGIRQERALQLALTTLGANLAARQNYADAFAIFQEALASFPLTEHYSAMNIGMIYERQNDPELALQYYLRALDAKSASASRPTTVFVHLGLANVHRDLGNVELSREHQQQAVTIARETKRPGLIARSLVSLAESDVLAGQYDRAAGLLQEAVQNAVTVGYLPPHLDALLTLGRIELLRGRSAEALRVADEILTISEKLDFPGYERYAALMLRGRAHRAQGDDGAALEAFAAAAARLEEMRGAITGAERQQRLFFERFAGAYVELVDLLAKQNRVGEALTRAEHAKGRVLLDALQNGRRDDQSSPERKGRVDELQRLNRELIRERAKENVDTAAIAGIEVELRRVQIALDDLDAAAAASNRVSAPTIDAAGLRRLAARDDVAFAEYVVHDQATYLFVIRRGADGAPAMRVHRIDVTRDALERRVRDLVRQLAERGVTWRAESRALYDLLVAPAAGELKNVRALGIVPDGILWRVPFEALVGRDGRFLVEQAACFYAPSLSVLDAVQTRERKRGGDALLAFGNPLISSDTRRAASVHRGLSLGPLPDAEREVHDIARVYGRAASRVYVGAEAREERAKAMMSGARVVHFATHGLLDDRNPMYSQLVLARSPHSADDGALQAWELMRLDIGADLVVLSACDTARGRVGAGEGLIGMSWALFAAGSPSTVATLWKIASASTTDLMVGFHRELARNRESAFAKAEALREAQLRFIRDPRRQHPYYWSPFVLVGSPR